MRITAIEVYHVHYGLKDKKYAWSGGHSVTSFLSNIVKVCTDEGSTATARCARWAPATWMPTRRALPRESASWGPR